MGKKIRFENILLILLSISVVFLVYSNINSENKTKKPDILEVGYKIDNLLMSNRKDTLKIVFENQEKPVLLFFLAEGCGLCKYNIQDWFKIYDKYHNTCDIYFITANNVDTIIDLSLFSSKIKVFKFTDDELNKMKINAVPLVYLFDLDGILRYSYLGKKKEEELGEISKILKKLTGQKIKTLIKI